MQIPPTPPQFIAHAQRRHASSWFATSPNPQLNIRYGCLYLRYLLDRYDGNEVAAVAAYNAGPETSTPGVGRRSRRRHPLPRDRAYVQDVLEKREQYRDNYADELGLQLARWRRCRG